MDVKPVGMEGQLYVFDSKKEVLKGCGDEMPFNSCCISSEITVASKFL